MSRRSERIQQRVAATVVADVNQEPRQAVGRRCSFCRETGHNISRCNSVRLDDFENRCIETVRYTNDQDDFKIWLRDYYISDKPLVQTFVIVKMGYTSQRVRIANCMILITDYMFEKYGPAPNLPTVESAPPAPAPPVQEPSVEAQDLYREIVTFVNLRNRTNMSVDLPPDILGIERTLLRQLFTTAHSLNIISRMRQQLASRKFNIQSIIEISGDDNAHSTECSICWNDKAHSTFVKFGCNHEFCKDCVVETLRREDKPLPCCALCRSDVRTITSKTVEIHTELAVFIV